MLQMERVLCNVTERCGLTRKSLSPIHTTKNTFCRRLIADVREGISRSRRRQNRKATDFKGNVKQKFERAGINCWITRRYVDGLTNAKTNKLLIPFEGRDSNH